MALGKSLMIATVACLLLLAAGVSTLNHASPQVAFMGDSITQGWALPRANFGIHGQTTAEMRERFARQIGGHGFRTVIILGGTNDTLLHLNQAETLENLSAMTDLARQAQVEPVLCELPPIYTGGGQYLATVARLNAGIKSLARARNVKLVDYYGALNGSPHDFSDGTHLKRRGYLRMEWALLHIVSPF